MPVTLAAPPGDLEPPRHLALIRLNLHETLQPAQRQRNFSLDDRFLTP